VTTLTALPFTYDETDVPTAERSGGVEKQPNPHTDVVMELHANVATADFKHARTFAVERPEDEKEAQKIISRHVRWLREIGDAHTPSFSVRTGKPVAGTAKVGTGKNVAEVPVNRITFWVHTKDENGTVVPARIVRTAKK
jgi:hypothetical protein